MTAFSTGEEQRWRHLEFDWEWGVDGHRAGFPGHPDLVRSDNKIVNVLYGPQGQVMRVYREREEIPFGFQA